MGDGGAKVLVVDDDLVVLRAVTEILRREGHEIVALADPIEALAVASDPSFDVVVTDIRMPNITGIQLLKRFKQAQPEVEVVVMTGHATVETALEAVRAGAYDYLTKPFERIEDFSLTVARAVERRRLKKRAETLEVALANTQRFEGLTGQSAVMQSVYKLVETVGPTSATVLIQGESGTGKELVARALHVRSPRRHRPFVSVNCAALTDTLLDSELFGHVKGAFTGAMGTKKGLFEAADGGTIFLDEIGDISPPTQVRLLRVLQEGEIKRVGANENIKVDVRVVAATHQDLAKAMSEGRFREDLFYRLNVISLKLPALRERADDVPLLAQHFLAEFSRKLGKPIQRLTAKALEALMNHRWPGNVRELENVMERAVVLTQQSEIDVGDLPAEVSSTSKPSAEPDFSRLTHLPFARAKSLTVSAFERRYLSAMLQDCGNNISQAALAAGMDRSNFRRLLKEHGLMRKSDAESELG